MPTASPRHTASTGPRGDRLSEHFATHIRNEPQLALVCVDNEFPLQVFFYLCSLENFVVVRSVMPLYAECVHGLYSKQSARQWAADLQSAGFRPLKDLIDDLPQGLDT